MFMNLRIGEESYQDNGVQKGMIRTYSDKISFEKGPKGSEKANDNFIYRGNISA